jgi:putative hydrolase of the HAD superfamily
VASIFPYAPLHLHFVVDSNVVGISKPDPRIFALGLQAAGTAPEETVHVGDSYFVDVIGARQAGLGAVLFDPGRTRGPRDCPIATDLCAVVDHALS